MMKAEVKKNFDTGKETLVIHYDPEKDDYDELVMVSMVFYDLNDGKIPVFVLPG